MSLIAHVTVPTEKVLIGDLLPSDEEFTMDLVEVVPTSEGLVPYVRVTADETIRRSFERTAREDDRVASMKRITTAEESALYRVRWVGAFDCFLESCIDEEILVKDAVGTSRRWYFELLVPDHATLTSFHRRCSEHGITVTLQRIYDPEDGGDRSRWGLTEAQHEAITLARRKGYFGVPRGATLTELAEELDISHQAMSGRLRRGLETLVDNTVMDEVDAVSTESQ